MPLDPGLLDKLLRQVELMDDETTAELAQAVEDLALVEAQEAAQVTLSAEDQAILGARPNTTAARQKVVDLGDRRAALRRLKRRISERG